MTPSPAPIGSRLRRARLERSLSIEETAWRTRIRPDLLRELERDEFGSIGHRAFVRRHIASYARFLGVDPGEVLAAYASSHDEPEPSSIEELDRQRRVSRKPPRAKWLISGAVSSALLAAASAVGLLGGQAEPPGAVPAGPRVERAVSRSGTRILPVPTAEARVLLRVAALAETGVSISVDGRQVYEGLLPAGAARTFRGRDSVEVVVADGGAVEFRHNGRDLGSPGASGTAWRGRFGPRGRLSDA